ncbi:MAG: hypothetical protein ACRYGI_20860 [Janthinobacterium lividum]
MRLAYVSVILAAIVSPALADDLTPTIDEASANWVAASFHDGSEIKICFAASTDQKFAFRSDQNDLEFRTSDESWSLSAAATGSLTMKVGSVEKTVQAVTLNATTLWQK